MLPLAALNVPLPPLSPPFHSALALLFGIPIAPFRGLANSKHLGCPCPRIVADQASLVGKPPSGTAMKRTWRELPDPACGEAGSRNEPGFFGTTSGRHG